jgi:RHS repeat-associated protein
VQYTRQRPRRFAQTYAVHRNHLYSPAALTDSKRAVVERYAYDAYGTRIIRSGSGTALSATTVGFERGFTGYAIDRETGLHYARARMYSSSLGRFISRDPWMLMPVLCSAIRNQNSFELFDSRLERRIHEYANSLARIFAGSKNENSNWRGLIPQPEDGYKDGPSLYSAFFSPNNLDPSGTDILLKTGNNTGNPINDAVHQNICADICDNSQPSGRKIIGCFSFGANGDYYFFRLRRSLWLGFPSVVLGGPAFFLQGEIYETDEVEVGDVVNRKKTTDTEARQWVDWMRKFRVGTQDVYSVARHNCRLY